MKKVNYRRDPFNATFNAVERQEIFQVPASKIIQLSEMPLYSATAADRVKVYLMSDLSALAESFAAVPGVGQYTVDYIKDNNIPAIAAREGTGRVYVNLTTGTMILVKYQGIGNIDNVSDETNAISAMGAEENGVDEEIIDKRAFKIVVNALYLAHSSYIIENYMYTVLSYASNTILRASVISGNFPTAISPTGHVIKTGANTHPKTGDGKVISFLTSDKRIGLFWHTNAGAFAGRINDTALNITDVGTWSDITHSANYNQYAIFTQIGNMLFIFGLNDTANTADNLAIKYDVDTGTSYALADLPNNWQYGACEYDGDGNIWLFGNKEAGNTKQVLKYNILADTYTAQAALSADFTIVGAIMNTEKTGFILQTTSAAGLEPHVAIYYGIDNTESTIIIPKKGSLTNYQTFTGDVTEYIGSSAGASNDVELVTFASVLHRYKNWTRFGNSLIAVVQTIQAATSYWSIYRTRANVKKAVDSFDSKIK